MNESANDDVNEYMYVKKECNSGIWMTEFNEKFIYIYVYLFTQ